MYCRHCGKENPDDSVFCEHCGKRLGAAAAPAPKRARPKMQLRIKGRTVLIGAAVILCAVLAALLVSGLETGSLGAGTVRICVMDGKTTVSVNNTGESAGEQITQYELFTISEDGLPSVKYKVSTDREWSAEKYVYRYDHEGVVKEYMDFSRRTGELSRNEKLQFATVDEIIYRPLLNGEIDTNEIDGYKLIGIDDSRVSEVFNYFGSDCVLKYDAKGNVVEQLNYESNDDGSLRDVYKNSYTEDGKLQVRQIISSTGGVSYRYEYTYESDNKVQVKQITLPDGEEPVVVAYTSERTYDPNGLMTSENAVMNDFVLVSKEYRYHFVELEVPKSSVKELCSVYDYLGIEYVLEGKGVSVEQTMTAADLNRAWSYFAE